MKTEILKTFNFLKRRELFMQTILPRTSEHRNAGVPEGPCTYTEIEIFECHLDIQVVVFSAQNLNKVSSFPKLLELFSFRFLYLEFFFHFSGII